MTDSYLLVTPALLLAVFGLVRFIGCEYFFPLDPPAPEPAINLSATGGNHSVQLMWVPSPTADVSYRVKSGPTAGGPYTKSQDTADTFFTDTNLQNGVTMFYVVVAVTNNLESVPSNEASATAAQALVTSTVIGTRRNNFTGAVGAMIRVVAASPLSAVGLGRAFLAGNTGTHAMKIVDANTNVDIPGASTVVNLANSTVADGAFVYGLFAAPAMLNPNTQYYIVSAETNGGDQFADLDTTVFTTADATVESAVFGDGVSMYTRAAGINQMFGPVDLLY